MNDERPTIRQLIERLEQIAADYGDGLRVDVEPSIVAELPARKGVKAGYIADGKGGWCTLSGKKASESEALVDLPAETVLTFNSYS
jgi:hypothetical protein